MLCLQGNKGLQKVGRQILIVLPEKGKDLLLAVADAESEPMSLKVKYGLQLTGRRNMASGHTVETSSS